MSALNPALHSSLLVAISAIFGEAPLNRLGSPAVKGEGGREAERHFEVSIHLRRTSVQPTLT